MTRRGRGPRGAARADDARARGSMASVSLSEAEKVYIVHGVQVAAAAARAAAPGAPGPAGGAGPRFARVDGRVWVSLVVQQP